MPPALHVLIIILCYTYTHVHMFFEEIEEKWILRILHEHNISKLVKHAGGILVCETSLFSSLVVLCS
jgi:hypothetical protein